MHIFKVYGVSHEFGFLTWLLLPCDGIHVRSSPRSRVHAVCAFTWRIWVVSICLIYPFKASFHEPTCWKVQPCQPNMLGCTLRRRKPQSLASYSPSLMSGSDSSELILCLLHTCLDTELSFMGDLYHRRVRFTMGQLWNIPKCQRSSNRKISLSVPLETGVADSDFSKNLMVI